MTIEKKREFDMTFIDNRKKGINNVWTQISHVRGVGMLSLKAEGIHMGQYDELGVGEPLLILGHGSNPVANGLGIVPTTLAEAIGRALGCKCTITLD